MDQEGINDCPICGDGEDSEHDPDPNEELAYCPNCNIRYVPVARKHLQAAL